MATCIIITVQHMLHYGQAYSNVKGMIVNLHMIESLCSFSTKRFKKKDCFLLIIMFTSQYIFPRLQHILRLVDSVDLI